MIYRSMGCILYELVELRHAFPGTIWELPNRIVNGNLPNVAEGNFNAIIQR